MRCVKFHRDRSCSNSSKRGDIRDQGRVIRGCQRHNRCPAEVRGHCRYPSDLRMEARKRAPRELSDAYGSEF
jgi:hypothetical protein